MPLGNLFPNLPLPIETVVFTVVGFMGALALIYSVLLEAERRQDAVIVVGAASLFLYALYIGDTIFMLAMLGMFLVAGRELIQIVRHKHHHTTEELRKYKQPDRS